jgi:hypothetical protein
MDALQLSILGGDDSSSTESDDDAILEPKLAPSPRKLQKKGSKRRGTADFYSSDFQSSQLQAAALAHLAADASDDNESSATPDSSPRSRDTEGSFAGDTALMGPETPLTRSLQRTLDILTDCGLPHLLPRFRKEKVTYDTLATLVEDTAASAALGLRVGEVLRVKKALLNVGAAEGGGGDPGFVGSPGTVSAASSSSETGSNVARTPLRRRNSFEAWLDELQPPSDEEPADGEDPQRPRRRGSLLQGSIGSEAAKALQEEFYSFKDSAIIEDVNEIELGTFIADGTSGGVYKGRWKGMACAVKRFHYTTDDVTLSTVFKNEVFLLRNLNHDNLLRFYGACIKPPHLCIVTELLVGSLMSLLYGKQSKRPDGTAVEMGDKRQLHIAHGIANGMAFLHSHSVAHRDLKSANVLYDRGLNVRLCDFAFSKFKQQYPPPHPHPHTLPLLPRDARVACSGWWMAAQAFWDGVAGRHTGLDGAGGAARRGGARPPPRPRAGKRFAGCGSAAAVADARSPVAAVLPLRRCVLLRSRAVGAPHACGAAHGRQSVRRCDSGAPAVAPRRERSRPNPGCKHSRRRLTCDHRARRWAWTACGWRFRLTRRRSGVTSSRAASASASGGQPS